MKLIQSLFLAVVMMSAAVGARAQEADYRIGPKDLLEIRVLEVPDLNVERRVNDNGIMSLPIIGEVSVQGLTATEVRDKLGDVLRAKFVNRANVSVVVKEFANKPVSIVGAVVRPGSLNISGRWTLLQAISAAGGLAPNAGKRIYILRTSDNGMTDTLEIKTDDLFRNSSAKWNIPIYPSDVVNIPAQSTVTVFAMGEVKSPGALEFDADDRLSLLTVLAKAGGLTDRASKSIRIKRRGADGKDVETVVDYGRILSGRSEDPAIQPNDVVIVKVSFL
jgi:polysaccharide export outer membrane protein